MGACPLRVLEIKGPYPFVVSHFRYPVITHHQGSTHFLPELGGVVGGRDLRTGAERDLHSHESLLVQLALAEHPPQVQWREDTMLIPGIVLGVSYRLRNRYHVTGQGIVVIIDLGPDHVGMVV